MSSGAGDTAGDPGQGHKYQLDGSDDNEHEADFNAPKYVIS